MSNIDYKAEVMKYNANAEYWWASKFNPKDIIGIWYGLDFIAIATGNTEQEAWQSAYETLKKEGKIK